MFDVIFSLYYELCPWHSCRSYCLNKFDISNRMNYFQSIPKYFLECTIWHASHYTGYTFFLFRARGYHSVTSTYSLTRVVCNSYIMATTVSNQLIRMLLIDIAYECHARTDGRIYNVISHNAIRHCTVQ